MIKEKVVITSNTKETQKIGEKFAKRFHLLKIVTSTKGKKALVIALYGELGSGKTTFVQGLAHGLGIKRRIISPTFIIMRKYKTKLPIYSSSEHQRVEKFLENSSRQARTIDFYHIDLYRIDSIKDIKGLGIEEIINDSQNIVAIEWAEKMGKLFSRNLWVFIWNSRKVFFPH